MTVYHDQAIFDAIAAAIKDQSLSGGITVINTKAFIDTFNGHRDRKLCTSLDVAQAPDGADGVAAYERGFTDGVFVGREMPQRIPCDKCGKPLHDADQNLRGHKILCDRCVEEPSPAATRDDDARARFLADRADTERKQASNPSSQASTSE